MCSTNSVSSVNLQARFVDIMPRIESQARIYFRDVKCVVRKADCIAEAVAIAWKWFGRLAKKGKDASKFVCALATLAARAVRNGRRLGAGERANDVMSSVAQRRHGFVVQSLPYTRRFHEDLNDDGQDQRLHDAMEERLVDNTITPVPDQAAFRIDFSKWLKTWSARERRIIRAMSVDERTKDLSQRFSLSPGRISQMRREFRDDWRRFVGDEIASS
jgi:hypothetical protein